MTNCVWLSATTHPVLASNAVHVWQVPLNPSTTRVQQLAKTLSSDEEERAERFYFAQDRRRFVTARGALRTILGRYLRLDPTRLQFNYGPQGKPYLAKQLNSQNLQFNLAHSHELALLAFTLNRAIGVDLEYLRSLPDLEQIATRFFSVQENTILSQLPAGQKPLAFFNGWTRKEAYIKAKGGGLSIPLDSFDVSLTPGRPAALLNVKTDPHEATRWTLQALQPAPNYVAALAVEGDDWQLACWQGQA